MSNPWQPLLDGELAAEAWRAIRAIAREIEKPETGAAAPAWDLAGGAAGTALFYAYLGTATGEEAFEERALEDLEGALEAAATRPYPLGLWQGLMGASFAYDHLAGRLFVAEETAAEETAAEGPAAAAAEDGQEEDADTLLQRHLARREENYDLIQGLAGFGIACLEGLPRPAARRSLDRVLDQLLAFAEPLDGGTVFFTPPQLLPPWQAELAPEGYYNLGAAHGMPAVVVLLARCLAAGIRAAELRPLLEGVVGWMLAQRGAEGFPSWAAKGRPAQRAARLAWCYGDPGIAATLAFAARAAGRPDWLAIAADVARQASRRDLELAGIRDAGICHGAAGLAHMWNRLWQASGCPEIGAAARFWFAEVLKMRRAEGGIGGYRIWSVPRGAAASQELGWVDDPGLLTGSAGIGLCLLAAVSPVEPEWDRLLALSG